MVSLIDLGLALLALGLGGFNLYCGLAGHWRRLALGAALFAALVGVSVWGGL